MLFRWDAPLFFANAEEFAQRVRQAIASSPTPARWVIVAAEPVTDLDTTSAADVLWELEGELAVEGVDLRFAEMGPVKDRLKRYALYERFGDDHFYPGRGSGERLCRRDRGQAGPTGDQAAPVVGQGHPSTEPDGLRSGRRTIRNRLSSPTTPARIGIGSAT